MVDILSNRILNFLERHPEEWVASSDMQRVVADKTGYDPRTAVRRMQEMAKKGILESKINSGHAFYRFVPKKNLEFGVIPVKDIDKKKDTVVTSYCTFCQEEKEVSAVLCLYCKNKYGLAKAPVHKLCDKCFSKGHVEDLNSESFQNQHS